LLFSVSREFLMNILCSVYREFRITILSTIPREFRVVLTYFVSAVFTFADDQNASLGAIDTTNSGQHFNRTENGKERQKTLL